MTLDGVSLNPPRGFEPMQPGQDFSLVLGTVFLHRDEPRLGFRVSAGHGNPMKTCHGGALATFADMQIAALLHGSERGGPHRPTITLSIDYVAPVPVGSWVEAEVTLVRQTRTLVFTTALLTVECAVVARSNAIYRNREVADASSPR